MITQWVEGPILADVFLERFVEEDLLPYVWGLHRVIPDITRTYDVEKLATMLSSNANTHKLESINAAQLVPCHNDLNPWNVIIGQEGWTTLDWEFVGLNDPLFDLIALHVGLELADTNLFKLADNFLGGCSEQRFVSNLRRFWVRELTWADYQLSHGNLRDEIRHQQTVAYEKLRSIYSGSA